MPADVAVHPVEELAARFARLIEESSQRSISERGTFSMAVPGGSAAIVLLPSLKSASIDWDRVSVFWVDERMVPPDHADLDKDVTFEFRQADRELLIEARCAGRTSEGRHRLPA